MMPGISGYDVLTLLKRDPRFREIPVIMISALSELDSIVRCIEAGADDYLAKPFDPTLLRARVGSSLEKKHLRDREREMVEALRIEKERSEQLLLNILPKAIVTRLNCGETVIADQLSDVTILFSDLVDFTRLSSQLSARDLVRLLNGLFSEFDRLALGLGVEKIKTIGDAYMLAGGLPEPRTDHAHAVADMALAMIEAVERVNCEVTDPPADAHRHSFRRRGGRGHRDPQIRLRHLGRCGEHRQSHGVARYAELYPDLGCNPSAHPRAAFGWSRTAASTSKEKAQWKPSFCLAGADILPGAFLKEASRSGAADSSGTTGSNNKLS